MPRSFSSVHIHVVFSTKDRRPLLTNLSLRQDVHNCLGRIAKEHGCEPLIVGGVADHVHILCGLGKTISQADLVKELKRVSSLWVKERDSRLNEFNWQGGYGAFSIDTYGIERVRHYIAKQEQHHEKMSFQDEFRALLKEHGIECEEKYIWD
jgi:REP element-mobilizing transposase RayT